MRLPLFHTGIILLALTAADAQAQNRFRGMDANNDGVITRAEWHGNAQSFRNHDWNGDGVLSGDEVRAGAERQPDRGQDWNRDGSVDNEDVQIAQRYRGYDLNADGRVTPGEWPGQRGLFDRLDSNRDGSLTMEEYMRGSGYRLDAAWQRGYDRGVLEGRAAGREDYTRRQRWDLEGQRELEGADSGYTSSVGSLTDYREGYREGFRMAYRDGFYSARDNR